ncbi:MAG: GNAT family N-acetyltransferase, partial [Planctomycetes bacterium]|nr:GNAT family N-acetyltransferase [Planctomycetota bacterium]
MNEMVMRKMTSADYEQYDQLWRYAFQVTEKTLLDYGWEDDEIRQSKFPVLEKASVLGWFEGERLASQFAVLPLQMNVHGNLLDIGFITSVATFPEYSGMGLMSKLMRASLEEMRMQGRSLAVLYPYSIPLYRHRGFEIVSDKMTFMVKDSQLPRDLDAPGHVRRVENDDHDLLQLHEQFARQRHGCILRNDLAWEEYWRWHADDVATAIYYAGSDRP